MTAYEPKIQHNLEYFLSLIRMFYRTNENRNQIERRQEFKFNCRHNGFFQINKKKITGNQNRLN